MKVLPFLSLGLSQAQWANNYQEGHAGMIHLFEWHWDWIADECESLLGPKKWGGVQVSPPNENRVIYQGTDRPWWERYQPISYEFNTRSGDRAKFQSMVNRCEAAGVRIYADVIPNHMCGAGGSGEGTAGTPYDADKMDFPGVPYSEKDFNHEKCNTQSGNIENYGDAWQVRNCRLVSLLDLDQSTAHVRSKIGDYMGDLIEMGVAGFRVDACKHMWPGDLEIIYRNLPAVNWDATARPFIAQEVIDQGGEPIKADDYDYIGRVTEFKYCLNVGNNIYDMQWLSSLGSSWGMLSPFSALVFVNNHDNQRGHGGGGHVITFQEPWELKLATVFMMAHDYGEPRVMSSYEFSNGDQGPPTVGPGTPDQGCRNGWICEHRWSMIANTAMFRANVDGTGVTNWVNGGQNQIAFSRGSKGFVAINGGSSTWAGYLPTDMPNGEYCDLMHGDPIEPSGCTGPTITVAGGRAEVNIATGDAPMIAIVTAYQA